MKLVYAVIKLKSAILTLLISFDKSSQMRSTPKPSVSLSELHAEALAFLVQQRPKFVDKCIQNNIENKNFVLICLRYPCIFMPQNCPERFAYLP